MINELSKQTTAREFLKSKIGHYNPHHPFSEPDIEYSDIENWLDEYKNLSEEQKSFKTGKYLNAWGKAFVAIQIGKTPKGIRELYKSGKLKKKITVKQSVEWNKLWKKFLTDSKAQKP